MTHNKDHICGISDTAAKPSCALALGNVGYISWASAVCDVDATETLCCSLCI